MKKATSTLNFLDVEIKMNDKNMIHVCGENRQIQDYC